MKTRNTSEMGKIIRCNENIIVIITLTHGIHYHNCKYFHVCFSTAAQKKRGTTEIITPEVDKLHSDAGMSGVMTRSRLKRLSESNIKEVCENRKMLFGTPPRSENSTTTRRSLLRSRTGSPEKLSLTPKCTSSRKSRRSILLEAENVTSFEDNSVTREIRRLRNDRSLTSDNGEQYVTNAGGSVSVALYNNVQDNHVKITISGLCNNLKSVVLVNDAVGKGTEKSDDRNSKINSQLRGTELLDGSLIYYDCEQSPGSSQKERKAKKSRKSISSPSNKNEWTISTISETVTELEHEMDVEKSPQNFTIHEANGKPAGKISPLPTEMYEFMKLPITQSKNSSDTESASVDNACEMNKTNDTDVYEPRNVLESSAEKTHKKKEKFEKYNERGSDEILEDIEAGGLDSDDDISLCKSTDADDASAVKTIQEENGTKSPVLQVISSENRISNNSVQDSASSQTKCVENNYENKSSPIHKTQIRKDSRIESSEPDSDAESRKAIMESAQKRIIQNISTSESESRKFVKPFTKSASLEDTSDSDSAPEDISFSTGRQLVMESLKNATESIQREKCRRKEKRKERLEKYKQQKEEKVCSTYIDGNCYVFLRFIACEVLV